MKIALLILLASACAPAHTPQAEIVPQGLVEQSLRAVARGAEIPSDFLLTYSDEHPLHGGTRISISGTGAYEWRDYNPRTRESTRREGSVHQAQLRSLIDLLVELRGWQQETVRTTPVPDQSIASLVIRAGGAEARMWEKFNDMSNATRLGRIRARMSELRPEAGQPSEVRP